jgi:catechol 2,3-dioxygenase-like lactoylglutathione lyase family enzyme
MNINGIAHVQLTVNDYEACRVFYGKLLELFEMKVLADLDGFFYCIGGRTGVAIGRATPENRATRFDQRRAGLHHLCFRLRSREDVDALHDFLVKEGTTIVHPPEDGHWAPGYYSVLFEDPDGLRLEANYVPGKGHLEASAVAEKP